MLDIYGANYLTGPLRDRVRTTLDSQPGNTAGCELVDVGDATLLMCFALVRDGSVVDEYNSDPDFAGEASADDVSVAATLGAPPQTAAHVAPILAAGTDPEDGGFVFEVERHAELVEAPGLPPAAVGCDSSIWQLVSSPMARAQSSSSDSADRAHRSGTYLPSGAQTRSVSRPPAPSCRAHAAGPRSFSLPRLRPAHPHTDKRASTRNVTQHAPPTSPCATVSRSIRRS